MSPSQVEYLQHMLDETDFLLNSSKDVSFTKFLSDETLKRAYVRSLEIIGEASKKVSIEFKLKYPELEWKMIAGTRDKLIHDYFGVDYELVWDIVTTKIPALKGQVTEILQRERKL